MEYPCCGIKKALCAGCHNPFMAEQSEKKCEDAELLYDQQHPVRGENVIFTTPPVQKKPEAQCTCHCHMPKPHHNDGKCERYGYPCEHCKPEANNWRELMEDLVSSPHEAHDVIAFIEQLLTEARREERKRVIEIIEYFQPTTDEYDKGWNDCARHIKEAINNLNAE